MNKVELKDLVGGALQEKFNKSFEKVIDNLQDVNTSFKVKRKISISLDFVQNEERDRETLVVVNAKIPEFPFDSFINQETFCINLQAKFIYDPETDLALVLKFAGTVETGTVTEYGDDGVTQKATVKTGIASKSEAVVPNPVTLRPYRTFLEVEQPKSDFIFRMKQDKYDGINCAIIEADGGAWKMEATKAIKDYLQYELSEYEQFTVIS